MPTPFEKNDDTQHIKSQCHNRAILTFKTKGFAVSRETTIFLRLLLEDNKFAFFNKPSPIFVQTKAKILPYFYTVKM